MVTLDDVGISRVRYRKFTPTWTAIVPKVTLPNSPLKDETMLFNSGLRFAEVNGGPITQAFITTLHDCGVLRDNTIIDSRVHMLMPGWYPCIPGWHIDDFYRPTGGQPDLDNAPSQRHYMMIVGECSKTQFLNGTVSLAEPLPGELLYDSYNRQINGLLAQREVGTVSIPSDAVISFGNADLHRGVAATNNGWRMFIRASVGSSREPSNEIRRQTQVYLSSLEAGW